MSSFQTVIANCISALIDISAKKMPQKEENAVSKQRENQKL